ncbi:Uncharacterised protein [Mycobacteroides abscessus subsp. massiliense]|nr:Uncharacterised protein [Mycobacteroides abscessus subsp. massiliense]
MRFEQGGVTRLTLFIVHRGQANGRPYSPACLALLGDKIE